LPIGLSHCLTHRLPEQHKCSVIAAQKAEQQRERAKEAEEQRRKEEILRDVLPPPGPSGKKKPARKKTLTDAQRQRAAKVRVMKLRGKAKGQVHIPQADRIYFEIAPENGESQAVFVSRHYAIGRVISAIESDCVFDILRLETESEFPLDPNAQLAELLELGILLNGDKLLAFA